MIVFLSLGSNVGDSIQYLMHARNMLETNGILIKKESKIYKTEPQGDSTKPWYYNQVLMVETTLEPEELLEQTKAIEKTLGRVRTTGISCEPRTIDIDILLAEDYKSNTELLQIPHPRMFERAFVLVPLHEIEPDVILYEKKCAQDFLQNITYTVKDTIIWQ